MSKKNFASILDSVLIFSLFFLSNLSAFISVIWLIPQLVFVQAVFWLVFAAIAVRIMIREGLGAISLEKIRKNWVILPFLVFFALSIFWSVYWEISLWRWLILLSTIITGIYIGLRYDINGIVKALSVFGACVLFFSVLLVFFVPDIGIMNYYTIQGAWRGVYWHKNHMGLFATFMNILFLINTVYSWQSRDKNMVSWGLLYLFSLLFVYQTDSVAAYMTTVFLHGVILLALILLKFGKHLRRSHYMIFLAVLIFVSLVLLINIDQFFGIFNRSTSLTGRIPMWTYLFDTYFSKHPLLGYGFNAFWYIDAYREAVGQAAGYPDPIVIADNGFIDILVNTGYAGLSLFLVFYFDLWWRSIKYATRAGNIYGVFPVILMSYTLLANISWSLIFENEGFFMLIMISVLFSIPDQIQINPAN